MEKEKTIHIVIDRSTIDAYADYYFSIHTKARKKPIARPYHESINTWMILKRAAMNNLKQKWKSFICWLVAYQGYDNLRIERCEIVQTIFYPTNARHDIDNSVPKFILDGFVESQMIIDDDCQHIKKLTMMCELGCDNPRTELTIKILD